MGGCTSRPKTAEYEGLMKQQQPRPGEGPDAGLKALERSNSSVHKSSQNTLQNLFVQHAKEEDAVVLVDGNAPTLQDFLLHGADAKLQTVLDYKEEGPKTLQTVLESTEDPNPPADGEPRSDVNAFSSEEAVDEDLASSSRELPIEGLHVIHKEMNSSGQLEDSMEENLREVSSHVSVEENDKSGQTEASQSSLQAEENNGSRQIEASQSSLQVEEKLPSKTCEAGKTLTEPDQEGTSSIAIEDIESEGLSSAEEKEDGGTGESMVEGQLEGGSKQGEDDHEAQEHSSAKEKEDGGAVKSIVEGVIEGGSKQGEDDVGEHGHTSAKEREDGGAQESIVEGLLEGGSKQGEDDVGQHEGRSSAKEREHSPPEEREEGGAEESLVVGHIEGGYKQGEDDVGEHGHSSVKEREGGQESLVEGHIEGGSKQGEDDVGEHQGYSSAREREDGGVQESIVESLLESDSLQGEDDVREQHGHSSSKEREDDKAPENIAEGQMEAWNGKGEHSVEPSADESHGSQVEATKSVENKEEEGGLGGFECKCTDADDQGEREVDQMTEGMKGLEGCERIKAATEGQAKEDSENGQSVSAKEKEACAATQGHPDADGHLKNPFSLCTETHGPSSGQATGDGHDDQMRTETITYTPAAPVASSNVVDIAADIHKPQDQGPIEEEKDEKAASDPEIHLSATIPSVILRLEEGSEKPDDSSIKDRGAPDSSAPQTDIASPSLPAHESHSDLMVDSCKPEEDALEQPAFQDKINQPHELEEGTKEDKASSENNAPFAAKVEGSHQDANVTN